MPLTATALTQMEAAGGLTQGQTPAEGDVLRPLQTVDGLTPLDWPARAQRHVPQSTHYHPCERQRIHPT